MAPADSAFPDNGPLPTKGPAETRYTDAEFARLRRKYDYCPPFTKESLLYREIFEKYYPAAVPS